MLSSIMMRCSHIDRVATRSMFFSAGFITAAWAALIPFVKTNVGISDGMMGLLLLCLGIGALVGMPAAGVFTTKYGCKPVLLVSVLSFSLLFPALSFANTPLMLSILLICFGMCIGITDCAMNIQAVMVEKEASKPLMSGFHGFYSLGGMTGAIILTLLFSSELSVSSACLIISAFVLLLLSVSKTGLRSDKYSEKGSYFAAPKGPVIIIGTVCFVFFLAEGTVLDWSGIFLTEYRSIPTTSSGMGVACFSVAMTLGRLLGDKTVSRIGSKRIVLFGSSIAMLGFIICLSNNYWQISLFGYALIGLGCSNIVPIMFSSTGKQNVMPESLAVTAVSTLGYVGVLAGPAIVGFAAELYGLIDALYIVVFLILTTLVLSYKIRM